MCRYRSRCFYSKQTLLILAWIAAVGFSAERLVTSGVFLALQAKLKEFRWFISILLFVAVISGIISGWLADAKIGNHKTVKAGLILIFTVSVLYCVVVLLKNILQQKKVVFFVTLAVLAILLDVGVMVFITNSLQLGIDQMPDVCPDKITSFISWYIFSAIGGFFVGEALTAIEKKCLSKELHSKTEYISILAPVVSITIALTTNFLFAEKWLIIEPKTPQTFKIIYQVLKFAWKHKAPLNRSPFTFWEEKLPSRIDLGKSKYGGPFTTEQVEDVKTILRLLVMSFSFWVIAASFGIQPANTTFNKIIPNWPLTDCHSQAIHTLINSPMYILIGIATYELIIFPFFGHKIPSTLKRIGLACTVITVASILLFSIDVVYTFYPNMRILFLISNVLYLVASIFCIQIIGTSIFEFACAQVPYNMRGLFVGYTTVWIILIFTFNEIGGEIYSHICVERYSMNNNCFTVFTGVKIVCSLFSLIFYGLVARWYKMRVRDEYYNIHRVVEDIYDRYLTSASNYKRQFKINNRM